jgi:endonuclease/exonuclease/phosphatase family metal-dependent hydrolase
VGDGLTTLSNYPVSHQTRQTWRACSGYLLSLNDCLGDKGFSVAHVNLSGTVAVHVYNLHADAGAGEQDVLARAEGFEQLAEFIEQHSKGAALIVGGDTNLDPSDARDHAILDAFLRRTGLTDACSALGCAESQIDRIFFRSSRQVELNIEAWQRDETFADSTGAALSDHPAIAARIGWQLVLDPTPSAVAQLETPLPPPAATDGVARANTAPPATPGE